MKGLTHYKYIDALRGFAFLGVLTAHAGVYVPLSPGAGVTATGRYGVQLFFLLSAVTLLRSLARRSVSEQFPVRNFFIRRFFRIAPLFWAAIIFYLLLNGMQPRPWAPNGLRPWHIILTALFSNGWAPVTLNSVVPGGWSVVVEMIFYVCLPFLAARVTSARRAFCASACAFAVARLLGWLLPAVIAHMVRKNEVYLIPNFLYFWFPSQLPVFLLGFAVYYLLHDEAVTRFMAQPGRAAWIAAGAGCGMAGLAFLDGVSPAAMYMCYSVLLGAVILALAARPFPLLVNRVTCGIGTLSFSCYVTHFAVLEWVRHFISPGLFTFLPPWPASLACYLAVWVLGLAGTVAVSFVTYSLIERPGIRLGNRIIRRHESHAGVPAVPGLAANAPDA